MKPFLMSLCCVLALIYLQSCGNSDAKKQATTAAQKQTSSFKIPVPKANSNLVVNNREDLVGYWVGMFQADNAENMSFDTEADYWTKINIAIDTITNDHVGGHTVIAGIIKPFSGTVKKDEAAFNFVTHQPGASEYDGTFTFSIKTGDTLVSGSWKANKKAHVPSRSFKLTKQFFHYNSSADIDASMGRYAGKPKDVKRGEEDDDNNPEIASTTEDVGKYNSSAVPLTKEDVANLKKADLLIMRNSIFARHGYAFKRRDLRSFFDRQPWYIPVSNNVVDQLTEIEKKNIELLNRYEKNAKEYYTTFAR
jgi:hypothetical protein